MNCKKLVLIVALALSTLSIAQAAKGTKAESMEVNVDGSVTIKNPQILVSDQYLNIAELQMDKRCDLVNEQSSVCKLFGFTQVIGQASVLNASSGGESSMVAVLALEGELVVALSRSFETASAPIVSITCK